MRPAILLLPLLALLALLSGCNSMPDRDENFAPVQPVSLPPRAMANGSIYQAGYERRWFEDIRARNVGDILTVQLVEQTGGSSTSSGSVSKSSTTSITNPTLFGTQPSFALPGGRGTANLGFDLASSSDFSGDADQAQSNKLSGSITVMVTEVLPNGYLRVRGEKRIGMNGGNEYVKLAGIVRPSDIDTTNTVNSTKIADATLVYKGDGQVAMAGTMGWLAKFFISALVPF